jgi:hypothetical protein
MYIGIYTEPIHNTNRNYKGINRLNIPSEFWTNDEYGELYELSKWYVENSDEEVYCKYNNDNIKKIQKIFHMLEEHISEVDAIVFCETSEIYDGKFLGFDVLGDDFYHSMIEQCIPNMNHSSPLSRIISEYFRLKINSNGLFSHLDDAQEFVALYKEVLFYTDGKFFETVNNPRPIHIYNFKDIEIQV